MTAWALGRSATQTSENIMRIDDVVVFIGITFGKNVYASNQFGARGNRSFEFDRRRLLFHPHAQAKYFLRRVDAQ
jgi:hypothetical protein